MLKKSNGFNLSLSLIAVSSLLAACGGGGGGGLGESSGSSSAAMTNQVTPNGVVEVEAGKNIQINSTVKVLRSSVTSQKWTVSQLSGSTPATGQSPAVVDASCETASKVPGSAPGVNSIAGLTGSANCSTSLVIPSGIGSSEWTLSNTAIAADSSSASGSFIFKIKSAPVSQSGFSLAISNRPQIQELGGLATLSASYVVNAGISVDSINYKWTQVSGPTVALAGANTNNPAFLAKESGEYIFKVTTTAVINGKTEVQEGEIVVSVPALMAIKYFEVNAGAVQIASQNEAVSLVGTVTGNTDSSVLSYEWTQVSGPSQVDFANGKTLTPSFIPKVAGEYVFQLKVSNSTGFKTANTKVAVKAATTPFFAVSAGAVQLLEIDKVATLKGSLVSGTPAPVNVEYTWKQLSGPTVSLANSNTLEASFTTKVAGVYEFSLTASSGGVIKPTTTSVVVGSETPFFGISAGDAQLLGVDSIATLKGSLVSGTPPPVNVEYTWKQLSGPTVSLNNANTLTASFATTVPGVYEFSLTATSAGVVKTVTTSVVVSGSTTPFFTVSAGDAQLLGVDVVATLKGTLISGKPAPVNVVYEWKQLSGPTVSLTNPKTLESSFVTQVAGVYDFSLTATSAGVIKTTTTSVVVK